MTLADDTTGLRALEAWLADRMPGTEQLHLAVHGKPGSGFSAETTILTGEWRQRGAERTGRFVLRRETPDPAVYPQQVPGLDVEVDIQYRVMAALAAHSAVPLAPLVGYEPDPVLLGAPFFVMRFVEGVVPVESPMYTLEGFFTELTVEARRTMVSEGVRALAAIHAVDWQAAGLEWLLPAGAEPTVRRQLDLWAAYSARELRGREHPPLARALTWLRADPPAGSAPVLNWGDPRPGNVIWRDARPACVTDFEAACIAPPELDLGWWLMFDRWSHESAGLTARAPGDLSRAEQVALYERFSGRSVGDVAWFEVFAAARYAAIVVRVMNRLVDRGDLPADQAIWIENPVVPCLVDLLDEVGA